MNGFRIATAAAALIALSNNVADAQSRLKIEIGNVSSLSGGPVYIALEKGYFAEAGFDVELHPFASAADMAALLATGRLKIAAGAVSVNFFNSLEQGFPTKIILSRNVSPTYHYLLVRSDLRNVIKGPRDLKGRTIASNARGSITTYEVGKMLEAGGLTLKDVELKFMSFGQMPIGLVNGALDAALMIPPLMEVTVSKGIAFKLLAPEDVVTALPIVIAVKQINTDWAAKNEKAVYTFVEVIMRAVREYCTAYHNGPNRAEVIRHLAKHSGLSDPQAIDQMEWGARDPEGRVFEASVMDVQDFYFKEGLIQKKFAMRDIEDDRYRKAALAKLPPFRLAHDDGKPGCR